MGAYKDKNGRWYVSSRSQNPICTTKYAVVVQQVE